MRQPMVSWLHAPTDLVNDLGAEPDHMERVEHCHRVREAVMNRVGIAAERIQGGGRYHR